MRFVLAFILVLALPAAAPAADQIIGEWVSQDGKGVVTIAPCGQALCGHITRLTEKARVEGPTTDSNNPNPALRNRSLVGGGLSAVRGGTRRHLAGGRSGGADRGGTHPGA